GARACHTSSICAISAPLHSASASLARRADTPIRRLPVTSFKSAQRPVASSASSHGARCPPTSARLALPRVATISVRVGTSAPTLPSPACGGGFLAPSPASGGGLGGGLGPGGGLAPGQINAPVPARSPPQSSAQP